MTAEMLLCGSEAQAVFGLVFWGLTSQPQAAPPVSGGPEATIV